MGKGKGKAAVPPKEPESGKVNLPPNEAKKGVRIIQALFSSLAVLTVLSIVYGLFRGNLSLAEQMVCWLAGGSLLVLAFRCVEKDKWGFASICITTGGLIILCGFSWFQGLAKTKILQTVTSTLTDYGKKLNDFQKTTDDLQAVLTKHQGQLDAHQKEINEAQGTLLSAQTNIAFQQRNLSQQYNQIQTLRDTYEVRDKKYATEQERLLKENARLSEQLYAERFKNLTNINQASLTPVIPHVVFTNYVPAGRYDGENLGKNGEAFLEMVAQRKAAAQNSDANNEAKLQYGSELFRSFARISMGLFTNVLTHVVAQCGDAVISTFTELPSDIKGDFREAATVGLKYNTNWHFSVAFSGEGKNGLGGKFIMRLCCIFQINGESKLLYAEYARTPTEMDMSWQVNYDGETIMNGIFNREKLEKFEESLPPLFSILQKRHPLRPVPLNPER